MEGYIKNVSPPPGCSERMGSQWCPKSASPKRGSPGGLSPLQLALAASTTTYQGYESYIEDGLICLKHKVRNLEKKKMKLEDYMKRLKNGESLNQDQLGAVEKYDEVIHNLEFAQELHKTLSGLTQDLLKAQKKAVRKEQIAMVEVERRRLCTVLQVQFLLQTLLQHEHIRKDLLSACNHAPHLQDAELKSLLELAVLLGLKRDKNLSLKEQMERAALVYLDLLEGKDKPVAGSTYKAMKEQLSKLIDSGYFDRVLPPPSKSPKAVEILLIKEKDQSVKAESPSSLMKSNTKDVPRREFLNRNYMPDTDPNGYRDTPTTQTWKEKFQAMKDQEPPDSWDMDLPSSQPVIRKPWKGAAVLIPKVPDIKKQNAEPKKRRKKNSKREQYTSSGPRAETAVEVFNSPSSLPKDPILRKQKLEDLMAKIRGSFSFMQDSLLDDEGTPTIGHSRLSQRASGCCSPLVQRDSRKRPADLHRTLHSTPLPSRLLPIDDKPSLVNGDSGCVESCDLEQTTQDLELNTEDLAHESCLQRSESETAYPSLPAPPLYHRESSISITQEDKTPAWTTISESKHESPCKSVVPLHTPTTTPTPTQGQHFSTPPSRHATRSSPVPFQTMHSVFKVNVPLLPTGDFKSDIVTRSESNNMVYVSTSTQTPPEFAPLEDEHLQSVHQSECQVGSGGQSLLSSSHSGGTIGRSGQSYYRGSGRGMARGGKGLAHYFRSFGFDGFRAGLRSPRGSFIPQAHLYGARDTGFQHSYRRGGGNVGQRNSAGWSDSSQVSSPDREGNYSLVDSAHGESLHSVGMDLTPQVNPHAPHTMMHIPMYPLHQPPQPLRVAFTAARTANYVPGTLDQPIAFDQLNSNLGDMFDTHLGRFTCPANGTYVFLFHILKLAVNVPLYVNLMRNDEVMASAYANDGGPDHETASNHSILQLYQGDQVWLRLHRGSIYGSSWKYSTFSGFLLYQD
ncbi:caprin-2 isoform X2 [Esox lucius]|uniref:caprin-2 isoform X2 n=1 Tax=Esox lucius TaxID=8010 RepID=UPI000577ED6A|nr:caprin-2 isoform X2 [Esox lucius]